MRMPHGTFQLDQLVTLAERKLPLRLGVLETVQMKAGIDLPPASTVVELPQDFREAAPCLSIERTTTSKGTHVDSTVTMTRSCPSVPPESYKAFREHVQAAISHLQEDLAFRVTQPKGAPEKKPKN
jgi:hypothetical protein